MCRNPFNYKVSCDTKVIINVCLFYHHLLVSDVIIADLTPYLDPNYLLILVTWNIRSPFTIDFLWCQTIKLPLKPQSVRTCWYTDCTFTMIMLGARGDINTIQAILLTIFLHQYSTIYILFLLWSVFNCLVEPIVEVNAKTPIDKIIFFKPGTRGNYVPDSWGPVDGTISHNDE